MKRYFLNTVILILCFSCKSQNSLPKDEIKDIKLIVSALASRSEMKIYKKSFSDEYYNSSLIDSIGEVTIITANAQINLKVKEIKDSLRLTEKYSYSEIDSISNILTQSFLNPVVKGFLAKEDLKKMKNTFVDRPIIWSKKILDNIEVTNDKNDLIISVPVFNIDNSIALVFVNYTSSISMEFYEKKAENVWVWKGGEMLFRAD
jgi:hypothetical protein